METHEPIAEVCSNVNVIGNQDFQIVGQGEGSAVKHFEVEQEKIQPTYLWIRLSFLTPVPSSKIAVLALFRNPVIIVWKTNRCELDKTIFARPIVKMIR